MALRMLAADGGRKRVVLIDFIRRTHSWRCVPPSTWSCCARLVFIAEEASFTKAAERVGRTQSAVTLQVQKLEAQVGQPLVARSKGGPVELTPPGRALVESARAMLKINDEALRALASRDLPTTVRLGVPSTYTPYFLAKSLDLFRAAYPNALVEVFDGYSCQVAPRVRDGTTDLVLCQSGHEPRNWPSTEVWRGPIKWICLKETVPEEVGLKRPSGDEQLQGAAPPMGYKGQITPRQIDRDYPHQVEITVP
jgi:DNA-binding transcriptional LysR family regulator